jgi:hypothetical protein
VSFLTAFYVGFRMPNLWSINYYIPSYLDGFGRRSLLGTLLYPLGTLRFDYHFIASVQAIVLAALLAALAAGAIRAGLRGKLVLIAFMVAPTGGYLFMEIGYVEQLLLLMLLAALAIKDSRMGLLIMAASLFVHEVAAFTIIPLYLARFVQKERYGTAVVQGAILVGVFGAIYLVLQTTPDAVIAAFLAKLQANAGYPVRKDYYDVFSNQFTGERAQNYYERANLPHVVIVLAIASAAAASFVRRIELRRSLVTAACMFVACAAPLMLGFLGWDTERWLFLSTVSSCLAVAWLARAPAIGVVAIAGLLALWTVSGTMHYFDGAVARPVFPLSGPSAFFTHGLPSSFGVVPSL